MMVTLIKRIFLFLQSLLFFKFPWILLSFIFSALKIQKFGRFSFFTNASLFFQKILHAQGVWGFCFTGVFQA